MASVHCLTKLIKFIRRTEWEEAFAEVVEQHLGRACSKFDIEPEEVFDVIGEVAGTILHGCALEDFMARDYEGGRNVVDEYLKRRGYAESPGARRYMQALQQSVMSLYEVSDIVPGESFLARDLIRRSEPVRVLEVSGTKTLKPWDRICARLIRQGSEWRMGGGVLLYQRKASDFLINILKRIDGKLPADLRELAEHMIGPEGVAAIERDLAETTPLALMAPTFTGIWLADTLERTLHPQVPKLVNSDGHPIVMCTTTFPLLPGTSAAACRQALVRMPDLSESDAEVFNWVRTKGVEPASISPPRDNDIILMSTSGFGKTLLGSVEIKRGKVVLSTNSRERAEVGEAMLARALAGLVDTPVREEITAVEMLAKCGRRKSGRRGGEVPAEVARTLVHAHLDRHYRKTLDEPLPALGNISPRDAARCSTGRSKVVDWLKDMENHAARASGTDPMASYDFGWIWRELGIAHMRL
jgi:hypothetical protein